MILHVVVIWVVGGDGGWAQYRSVKWSTKTIESQRSNMGSWWTLLVLIVFQTEDKRYWPALRGLPSHLCINTTGPRPANDTKHRSRLTQGLGKAATETRLRARYSVEFDSVLNQQSISGKIISLILCAWKPGFFESGHTCIHVAFFVTFSTSFLNSNSLGQSAASTWAGRYQLYLIGWF